MKTHCFPDSFRYKEDYPLDIQASLISEFNTFESFRYQSLHKRLILYCLMLQDKQRSFKKSNNFKTNSNTHYNYLINNQNNN